MTTQTEALKLARTALGVQLDALLGKAGHLHNDDRRRYAEQGIKAIDEALAQPEQEPENRCVRELREFAKSNQGAYIFPSWDGHRVLKYLGDTTPPQRKPLTDEQIEKLAKQNDVWALFRSLAIFDFVRAIEAAHGIKE